MTRKVKLEPLFARKAKVAMAPIQASYGRRVFLKDAKGYYWSTIDNALLHRMLCSGKKAGWHVHHIDLCTANNKRKNLIALPAELHEYIHKLIAMTDFVYTCPREECETLLRLYKQGKLDCTRLVLPTCMQAA